MQIAAQGDSKSMKKWIEEWQQIADPGASDKQVEASTQEFLSKFGGGI